MNNTNRPKALFLDRDGIITKMILYPNGYDSPQSSKDVFLTEGIVEIVKKARKLGFLCIEISNQPAYAKGQISKKTQNLIKNKIHKLLQNEGACLNASYICYHHPKSIKPYLALDCDCRKPKPGLIIKAANDLSIDLKNSFFLGDNATDIEAGNLANTKTILYLHSQNLLEKTIEAKKCDTADYKIQDLADVISIISTKQV